MILQTENTEVEVTTEEQMEQIEKDAKSAKTEVSSASDASPTDATMTDNAILTRLDSINANITFWMILWLIFNMLARFKSNFIKSTDRME